MRVIRDLAGQKFGRLTANHCERINGVTRWTCSCECGNKTSVSLSNLVGGKTNSCGCLHLEEIRSRALDLTGQRFGSLVVLERDPTRTVAKKIIWKCQCDCGNFTYSQTNNLRSGNSRSCNSAVHRVIKDDDVRIYRARYEHYKRGAQEKGIEFGLSIEEFKYFVEQPCHYCGKENSFEVRRTPGYDRKKINGIDKRDPNGGYTTDNCLPCCSDCNFMKGTFSYETFLNAALAITKNLRLK